MKAKHHFWSSLVLGGALYFATDSPLAPVGAMVGGFLIDADHVVDQLWSIYHGAPHTRKAGALEAAGGGLRGWFARYFRRRKLIRMPLIFHSYELLLALAAATYYSKTPLLIGLFSGYLLHLGLDLWRHHHEFRSPLFYLLSYRLSHRFRRDEMIKAEFL